MVMNQEYVELNAKTIDQWIAEGWEWGQPVSREVFARAKNNDWSVVLTPVKPVPREWFCKMQDAEILGLASGGGQQMAIFSALGARCTVLDYSEKQLASEIMVAQRENYEIRTVRADMTDPLPFADESFDLIFHPVSNCYIENIIPVCQECYRVLKKGGILQAGFILTDIYQDTNGSGRLRELNVPCFYATRVIKGRLMQ